MDEREIGEIHGCCDVLGMGELQEAIGKAMLDFLPRRLKIPDVNRAAVRFVVVRIFVEPEPGDEFGEYSSLEIREEAEAAATGTDDRCRPADSDSLLSPERVETHDSGPAELLGQDAPATEPPCLPSPSRHGPVSGTTG